MFSVLLSVFDQSFRKWWRTRFFPLEKIKKILLTQLITSAKNTLTGRMAYLSSCLDIHIRGLCPCVKLFVLLWSSRHNFGTRAPRRYALSLITVRGGAAASGDGVAHHNRRLHLLGIVRRPPSVRLKLASRRTEIVARRRRSRLPIVL